MTPSELLLAAAALVSSFSGAILAFVLWIQRPRYRRGRVSWFEGSRPSAPVAPFPSRPDEGSSLSFRPPRTWTDMSEVPVADVEDDSRGDWRGGPP